MILVADIKAMKQSNSGQANNTTKSKQHQMQRLGTDRYQLNPHCWVAIEYAKLYSDISGFQKCSGLYLLHAAYFINQTGTLRSL